MSLITPVNVINNVRRVENQIMCRQCSWPSHHIKATQNLFRHKVPNFVSSQKWILHSTGLNPLDHSVWDTL